MVSHYLTGDGAGAADRVCVMEVGLEGRHDNACFDGGEHIDAKHVNACVIVDDDSLVEDAVHHIDKREFRMDKHHAFVGRYPD